MYELKKEVLEEIIEALQKELKKEPLSPERVSALAEAIKAIVGIC